MFRTGWRQYLLIAPVQMMLLAFLFLPALYVIWLSFNSWSYGMPARWVGFENFLYVLGDKVFWRAMINTMIVVNLVVYLELAIAAGLAVALAGRVFLKPLVISIILMPYAITEVTAVVMWRYMFEPDVGMINYWLTSIGLGQIDWIVNRWHALFLVALLTVWVTLPFTFIILYSAVRTQSRETVEAAIVDGASRLQIFRYVTWPHIKPAVLIALIFRYIAGLRLFSEVWLLSKGGPARLTEVLAVYLYREGFAYQNFGVAGATGLIMLIVSLVIAGFYLQRMHARMVKYA
jgi:multiple sugar transport system permease protein